MNKQKLYENLDEMTEALFDALFCRITEDDTGDNAPDDESLNHMIYMNALATLEAARQVERIADLLERRK